MSENQDKNKGEKEFVPPEASFSFFVSTLAMQVSIFLGVIPNPVTNKSEENFPQAKFIIDTLGMLKEKTKGNLNNDEDKLLDNILYNLRILYIEKTKGGDLK